jgi:hypothetical protein
MLNPILYDDHSVADGGVEDVVDSCFFVATELQYYASKQGMT